MRWDTLFEIVFISFLIVLGIYMRFHPETLAPPERKPVVRDAADFTHFCDEAELAPTAMDDCKTAMRAARTEADRMRVGRTFGLRLGAS